MSEAVRLVVVQTDDVNAFMESEEFKAFDEHCRQYTEDVLARAMAPLTASERIEFLAWYGGMQWEGYWESRSQAAYGAVMFAISRGLG